MFMLGRRGAALLCGTFAAVGLAALPLSPARAGRSSPDEITARAYQHRIGMPGAFIRVSWPRPEVIPSSYILGYTLYRSSFFGQPQIVGGRDSDAVRFFIDSEATRTVTAWDGTPAGFGSSAGSRATIANVPGLIPGQQYQYQMAAAYQNGLQDIDGDGRPDVGEPLMFPASRASAMVTALAPPSVLSINGFPTSSPVQVDLSRVLVEWNQTPGANRYVIWVSTDPTFRRNRVSFSGGRTVPVDYGGPTTVSRSIRIKRGALRRARRVYITVGARRSGEPRPAPFGAIFSAPVTVRAVRTPPPPPG